MKSTSSGRQRDRRLELSLDERRRVFEALTAALHEEFDIDDVGDLRLSMLLAALEEPLAKVYYNRGIHDAARFLASRLDDVEGLKF
jgi:uncharacterized protein (DUF2164 family)